MLRLATLQDAADLARIINDAFIVEAFFKIGDRTSAEEIAALMNAGGEFLVLDNVEPGTGTGGTGTLTGCVYLQCTGDRAYFGMLSIARPGSGRGSACSSSTLPRRERASAVVAPWTFTS